jgi:hypothetical protein
MSAHQFEAHKPIARNKFQCKPSAIKARFDIEFETGAPSYVRFGAVLTRREVLALIECLDSSVRESDQGEQSG